MKNIIVLEQNELVLNDGQLGFLKAGDADPINFLSVDKIIKPHVDIDNPKHLPNISLEIRMGDSKSVYKREAYTLLDLLGDFGGFTDAILLIIRFITSFYSARMFNAAIATELPYS